MSDTPRTDAAAMEASGNCDDDEEGQATVGIRFARQLERELAASKAAHQQLLADIRGLVNKV